MTSPPPFFLVALGESAPGSDPLWQRQPEIGRIIRFRRASASGLRLGRRSLGLGADSLIVALHARRLGRRLPFLAANPWIAVALRLLGCRNVVALGLYASPGSRSFRLLRLVLGDSLVVANVEVEAKAWADAGGRSVLVPYGKSFGYPARSRCDGAGLRVFVGGSSDRDQALMEKLEREIRASSEPVQLTLAVGGPASSWHGSNGRKIVRTGRLSPAAFGSALSDSDVVFLPLLTKQRAAGHSVAIGALESGVPVACTPSAGMTGYIDGEFVRTVDPGHPLLPQLDQIRRLFEGRDDEIRRFWSTTFGAEKNVRAVLDAIGAADQ